MAWVRLDDHADDHPKVRELDSASAWAWVRILLHCNRHRTRGFVSDRVLARLRVTPRMRVRLTAPPDGYEHGLLTEAAGGLHVHDFATYQPVDLSETREVLGRKGGFASGEARRAAAQRAREEGQGTPSPVTGSSPAGAPPEPRPTTAGAPADHGPTTAGARAARKNEAKSSESHERGEATASTPSRPDPTRPDQKKQRGAGAVPLLPGIDVGSEATVVAKTSTVKTAARVKRQSKTSKAPDVLGPELVALRDYYVHAFEIARGSPPKFASWGRAMKCLRELLESEGIDLAKAMVDATFTDEWRSSRACDPWDILAGANKLRRSPPSKPWRSPPDEPTGKPDGSPEEQKARLDALVAATRKPIVDADKKAGCA
jgi:hypothetical protein